MDWLRYPAIQTDVLDSLRRKRIYSGVVSTLQYLAAPFAFAFDVIRWWLWYRRSPLTRSTFRIAETSYSYAVHPHNHTWANERAVELPVVYEHLRRQNRGRVLEIGNVLSNYFPVDHPIVDKYERHGTSHVLNIDILDYPEDTTYDLIISISTLEHIGWNEQPRDPQKVLDVLSKIRRLLRHGGRAVITLPIGYNTDLDAALRDRRARFSRMSCLRRVSRQNEWIETTFDDVLTCRYHAPFPYANGVVIGVIEHA